MEASRSAWLILLASPVPVIVSLFQTWYGVILPVVIDFVNKNIQKTWMRLTASLIVCLVSAALINFDQVKDIKSVTDAGEFMLKVSFIFTQAHVVYKMFWEKSQIRKDLLSNM